MSASSDVSALDQLVAEGHAPLAQMEAELAQPAPSPWDPYVIVRKPHWRTFQTHCKRGHEFTEANTYRRPDTNRRQCRRCKIDYGRGLI
jgi:hypothetical protein